MASAKKKNEVALADREDDEPFHIEYHPNGGKQVNVTIREKKDPNDPEVISIICQGLIQGKGLLKIVAENIAIVPNQKYIYREMTLNPNGLLANSIARAREEAHYAILDKCTELSETMTPANIEVVTKQIAWNQWHLAKIKPRKYSEKHFLEQTNIETPKMTTGEFEDIAYRIRDEV